jgi:neutral ceramidase
MTRITRWVWLSLAACALWLAAGCDPDEPPADDDTTEDGWPEIEPAELLAGSADGYLELPVGLPLSAYTGRSHLFGGGGGDGRDSAYVVDFAPSTGVQSAAPIHVIWLQSGGQNALLVKIDIAYAFDGLVNEIERTIGEATGVDVTDQVFLMTSHSHSSYGDFSQAHFLFLGHDRYNREIFERIATQTAALAAIAHEELQPAAMGVGLDPEFDPDDEIFRLRRGEHFGLVDDFGVEVGEGYKDPNLYLLRIDASQGTADAADDEPLAILFGFGIHGTVMGEDNSMVSAESSGAIEYKLAQRFDEPVSVMHFQTNGGDMSPAGAQDDFARMELIGERAAPRILALWDQTATSSEPVKLEALVRTVPMGRDIRVSRNGAVDLHYLPYEDGYIPDGVIYDANGVSVSPYDEFIAEHGAGLCGDDSIEIPFVGMGVDVFPYNSCAVLELVAALFPFAFYTDLYYEMEFPLWETRSTMIGALGIEPLPVTVAGEDPLDDGVVLGFLPGEPCTLLGRAFQKRIADEQGIQTAIPVGFSMDHEGYLMTVEDWMRGGYESQINIWGPLEGEFILERLLELTALLETTEAEDPAYPDFADQEYPAWPLETVAPDLAPGCGSVPDGLPEYLWTRDGWRPGQPQPEPSIPRVSGLNHFVFLGGDPVIDLPLVTLQHEQTPGSGDFEELAMTNGAPITDRGFDMLLGYTPDPIVEIYEEVDREHYWVVEWQAMTDQPGLGAAAGLPEGRYRFVARGLCTDPADGEYPYDGLPYEVTSEPFEVTGDGALTVAIAAQDGAQLTLSASYAAAPRGFRLLHPDSDYRTQTPLLGGDDDPAADVDLLSADGQGDPILALAGQQAPAAGDTSTILADLSAAAAGDYLLRITDAFGNTGSTPVTLP